MPAFAVATIVATDPISPTSIWNSIMILFLSILIGLCFAGTTQAADTKHDIASAGPASAPVIRASTNTVINYTGGTPGSITGSLDSSDSTFNRPSGCGAVSSVGTAAAYDTITFTNTTATNATVNIRIGAQGSPSAACAGVPDTYLTMYNDAFNPLSPLNNCALTNDDASGAADRCSALRAISVPAGAVRVFVLTAFNNAATAAGTFPYEVSFAGTTPVSLQKFEVE